MTVRQGVTGGDTRMQVFARVTDTDRHVGVTIKADLPDDAARAAARAGELHYAIRYNDFMGVRSDFFLAEASGIEWVTAAAKPVPERLRALAAAADEVC